MFSECLYNMYREYIVDNLREANIDIYKKYVLYPKGEISEIVTDVLHKEYGIYPEFYLDNYKYDGNSVLNFEQLKLRIDDKTYYLICSDRADIFNEIRNNLEKYVNKKHIIDLFSKKIDKDFSKEVADILNMIDKTIEVL